MNHRPLGYECTVFVWARDRIRDTILALLAQRGLNVACAGLTLSISKTDPERLRDHFVQISTGGAIDSANLALFIGNKRSAKYDEYLSKELLAADDAARELDSVGAHRFIRNPVEDDFRPTRFQTRPDAQ